MRYILEYGLFRLNLKAAGGMTGEAYRIYRTEREDALERAEDIKARAQTHVAARRIRRTKRPAVRG